MCCTVMRLTAIVIRPTLCVAAPALDVQRSNRQGRSRRRTVILAPGRGQLAHCTRSSSTVSQRSWCTGALFGDRQIELCASSTYPSIHPCMLRTGGRAAGTMVHACKPECLPGAHAGPESTGTHARPPGATVIQEPPLPGEPPASPGTSVPAHESAPRRAAGCPTRAQR